jgi:Sec-independent protein translocase protein TatA
MPFGLVDMLIIGVFALLIFRPKTLPQLSRGVSQGIVELKKSLSGKKEGL